MKTIFAAMIVALLLSSQSPAQETSSVPAAAKSKVEVEKIVHDYLMQHPEVIIDAINKYQENQRAGEKKRSEDAIISKRAQLQDPASPSAGAEAAKNAVTVVEFFDYRCGFCKKMTPTVSKFVDASQIHLIYKELPILGPDSTIGAKAALAARRQGAYLMFHQDLMKAQGPITMALIENLATKHKLDFAKLKADMEDKDLAAQLAANQSLATAIGVNATPSFVIGNELITGAMEEADFQSAISRAQKQ